MFLRLSPSLKTVYLRLLVYGGYWTRRQVAVFRKDIWLTKKTMQVSETHQISLFACISTFGIINTLKGIKNV
jgi:hypothetical protein